MRTLVMLIALTIMLVLIQGCADCKCKSDKGTCPSGLDKPTPPSNSTCVFEPGSRYCGGCPTMSGQYGETECFDGNNVGCDDCDGKCLECNRVRYVAGATCIEFKDDPNGCAAEPCDYTEQS